VPISTTELRANLPNRNNPSLSIDDQARCVLHLLLDQVGEAEAPQISPSDPFRCPNCDTETTSLASPYCSEKCKDEASFVRQLRAALANGLILTTEKQNVFGERLWWLLEGGLPLRESRIPEAAKRQVAKRCGSKCETCGEPMTAVENIGSGCNRPLHLRAVCPSCSQTKEFMDPGFSTSHQVVEVLNQLAERVFAPHALRACDDPESWDWRAVIRARRSAG